MECKYDGQQLTGGNWVDLLQGTLSQSSLTVVLARGKINVPALIEDILAVVDSEGIETSLLLGPTDPSDAPLFEGHQIGWLAWDEENPELGRPPVTVVDPRNLVDLRLLISKFLADETRHRILLGDFLDCVFTTVASCETLFILMSQIVTRIKTHNATGLFIFSEELHDKTKLAIAARFADRVIRVRAVEEDKGRSRSSSDLRAPISRQWPSITTTRAFALP